MIMPRDAPASTCASAKYTPYIHLSSHLIFYPSLHLSYLRRHRNGSQQRTVARTRRPSPEPDDRRQHQSTVARTGRPSPEPDDRRQNQSTVARTSRPSPEPDDHRQSQTTTVQTTSQRAPRTIQSIDRIEPESQYQPVTESNRIKAS